MLNWEEEQFHTPYLAWERKSETAWVLPGKAGCGWAGGEKPTQSPGEEHGPLPLTPKENRPRALPLKDPSPVLHQPRSQYEGMAWGQSLRIKATQKEQQVWQCTPVTALSR